MLHSVASLLGGVGPDTSLLGYGSTSSSIQAVAFYPGDPNAFFVGLASGGVELWDSSDFSPVVSFSLGTGVAAHAVALSDPEGGKYPMAAVGAGSGETRIIDLRSGGFTHCMRGHSDAVSCVGFAPGCSHILLSGSVDGAVHVYDIRRSGLLAVLDQNVTKGYDPRGRDSGYSETAGCAHFHGVTSLAFSSDGLSVYTAGRDGHIRAWDGISFTNKLVNYEGLGGALATRARFNVLTLSPGDEVLFYPNSDSSIGMYTPETGELVSVLSGHFTPVTSLAAFATGIPALVSSADSGAQIAWMPPDLHPPSTSSGEGEGEGGEGGGGGEGEDDDSDSDW